MIKLPDPIFKVPFQGSVDAGIAGGSKFAYTEGTLSYQETSCGKGVLISSGNVVMYNANNNLPLFNQAGAIEFKLRTVSEFGVGGMRYYFYNGADDQSTCFRIYHDATGKLIWNTRVAGVNQIYISSSLNWQIGEEHHIIVTWDFPNQIAYLYSDTVQLGSDMSFVTAVPNYQYFHLGTKAPNGDAADDIILSLRVYNEFFDESKINSVFQRRDKIFHRGSFIDDFVDRKLDRRWTPVA